MLEWYMIRATGTVAYLFLYLTVIVGLYSQVLKKRRQKIAIPLYLHEALSNWAFILVCGHLLFLLIDSYTSFKWIELLVPFSTNYHPIPMAFGILGLYFFIFTMLTSKLRKKIGYQKWRKLHALNPILYIFVTLHGLFLGTDFQGIILTLINVIPLLVMGILMLKGKNNLNEAH
ncbi:MAG: ferric reductase-like transmembrane domain-containing protein [Bacillota bacterium]|nr:ferric reductase-like transmembrane domain-containing protein [Bacillota bacterium]